MTKTFYFATREEAQAFVQGFSVPDFDADRYEITTQFVDPVNGRLAYGGRPDCFSLCAVQVIDHTTPHIESNQAKNFILDLIAKFPGLIDCKSMVDTTELVDWLKEGLDDLTDGDYREDI